jgi:hypothetical protein
MADINHEYAMRVSDADRNGTLRRMAFTRKFLALP